jgi:phosphoserine aminotransferase
VHITPNETIEGVELHWVPKTGDVPLVADMTSMILSKPLNVRDYGVIYAGAQKNVGQAGITIVIIREDLLQDPLPGTPTMYNYKIQAEHKSFYNTPPTYAWYMSGLVLNWMKRHGGVKAFAELNQRKAKKMYSFIDTHTDFYINSVRPDCRSIMNVPFSLVRADLTDSFLELAQESGLTNLKGHRIVGGMRASMYNAMPEAGVDALLQFMKEFMQANG